MHSVLPEFRVPLDINTWLRLRVRVFSRWYFAALMLMDVHNDWHLGAQVPGQSYTEVLNNFALVVREIQASTLVYDVIMLDKYAWIASECNKRKHMRECHFVRVHCTMEMNCKNALFTTPVTYTTTRGLTLSACHFSAYLLYFSILHAVSSPAIPTPASSRSGSARSESVHTAQLEKFI